MEAEGEMVVMPGAASTRPGLLGERETQPGRSEQ